MKTAYLEWKDCPVDELREFCLANVGTGHKTCETAVPPQVFKDFAKSVIEGEMGYEVDHYQYWISELCPLENLASIPENHDQEWQLKFPHTHQWDGITVVLYLQAPEEGGELCVLDPDMNITETFEAKPGFAAVMGDHTIHGVRALHGNTNRVTMIAGGYPYPNGQPKCRCPNRSQIPRVTN